MERFREERARIVQLQRLKLEGELVPRDEVHTAYTRMAGRLRRLGVLYERDYAPDARVLLEDTLGELRREVESVAGALPDEDGQQRLAFAGAEKAAPVSRKRAARKVKAKKKTATRKKATVKKPRKAAKE